MPEAETRERLRALPSVDRLAELVLALGDPRCTPAEAVAAARIVVEERRAALLAGAADAPDLVALAAAHLRPRLRPVLNGTGVVVHTNLGRAPLAAAAVDAVTASAGSPLNVELGLATGRRGGRDEHTGALLRELTGAQDALVVNNGAAAVLLAVAALTGRGGAAASDGGAGGHAAAVAGRTLTGATSADEVGSGLVAPPAPGDSAAAPAATAGRPGAAVVVSRGQLVEIGGGYRVPEVVAQAGARLVEVGTTNRTRLADYAAAVAAGAGLVLRVHPSNFRVVGFVQETPIEELCTLGVPVVDDLGSGALAAEWPALATTLADEPSVRGSVRAGADVVCFSGDKLLGGPQAGILVGRREAIDACRRHPLARALRLGRLPLVALEATLRLYRDPERALREIPVLAALAAAPRHLLRGARALAEAGGGEVVEAVARVGGGALPLVDLPGPVAAFAPTRPEGADALAARLRAHDPPLVARVADGRVLVDPRTLPGPDLDAACAALEAIRGPADAG